MPSKHLRVIAPLTLIVAVLLSGCAPVSVDTLVDGTYDEESYEEEVLAPANTNPLDGIVFVSDGSYDARTDNYQPYITKICDGSKLIYADADGRLYFFPDDPQCIG